MISTKQDPLLLLAPPVTYPFVEVSFTKKALLKRDVVASWAILLEASVPEWLPKPVTTNVFD